MSTWLCLWAKTKASKTGHRANAVKAGDNKCAKAECPGRPRTPSLLTLTAACHAACEGTPRAKPCSGSRGTQYATSGGTGRQHLDSSNPLPHRGFRVLQKTQTGCFPCGARKHLTNRNASNQQGLRALRGASRKIVNFKKGALVHACKSHDSFGGHKISDAMD